jgi:hypothetical protein
VNRKRNGERNKSIGNDSWPKSNRMIELIEASVNCRPPGCHATPHASLAVWLANHWPIRIWAYPTARSNSWLKLIYSRLSRLRQSQRFACGESFHPKARPAKYRCAVRQLEDSATLRLVS